MPGLDLPPYVDKDGELDDREMALAVAPYKEIIWRGDMLDANQITLSWTESMEIPGVILDALEFIQHVKAEIKEEKKEPTDGTR